MNQLITRGTNAIFEMLFTEVDGSPLIPNNPAVYPQVVITDPTGTIIMTGTGVIISEARYRFTWFVPVDTMLSNQEATYRISWLMVTLNGRQVEKSLDFNVIDSIDLTPTERSFTYLTMLGKSERLFIRFHTPPQELTLTVLAPDGSKLVKCITDLVKVSDQGQFVYYIDTPPLTLIGAYLVMWDSRQTPISPSVTSVQQLRVPENIFFYYSPSLRMLIDKAQKKTGLVQAYSDPDIYEYLQRGVGSLNAENPITNFNLNSIPNAYGFPEFLLLAAGAWALRAQYLTEVELGGFSFSGQTVTLDVDRKGDYMTMIGNIQEYLTANLSKTKIGWLRKHSIAQTAVRPYDFGLSSVVTRVQTVHGGTNNLLPLLSNLGII